MAGDLWKPEGDPKGSGAGKLVFLSAQNHGSHLYIVDAKTGEVLDQGTFQKKYEDGRYIYRFNKPGSSFKDVVVIDDQGNHTYIPNGSQRGDGSNITWSQAKKNTSGSGPKFDSSTFNTQVSDGWKWSAAPTSTTSDGIPSTLGVASPALLTGSNLNFDRITFEFTDPIETLRKLAAENRGQMSANYLEALQQAGQISEANKNQLIDYLTTMSPLQLQMVGIENAFNQQQKLQAAETAQPGITDLLRGEVKNAQTLASGRLLRDSEDRALEQTARSAGADAAWTRGLGDDSLVGRRLSDQLSVSQRLGVMQQGQNYMSTAVQLANQTLLDTPNKANLSQQIPGTPQVPFSNIISGQQSRLDQATTMSPEAAQSSIVGQRQAQAQLDADLRKDYNRYMFDIEAANTQAINTFNQDVLNARASQDQVTAKNEAYRQAAIAYANKWINRETYNSILAQIEQTGTVNMGDFVSDWNNKWGEYIRSISEEYSGNVSKSLSTQSSTFSNQMGTLGTTPITSVLVSGSVSPTKTMVSGDGKITLPQFNKNFTPPTTNLEYLNSLLEDIDLSGVF
jgi:hypothetical protein